MISQAAPVLARRQRSDGHRSDLTTSWSAPARSIDWIRATTTEDEDELGVVQDFASSLWSKWVWLHSLSCVVQRAAFFSGCRRDGFADRPSHCPRCPRADRARPGTPPRRSGLHAGLWQQYRRLGLRDRELPD